MSAGNDPELLLLHALPLDGSMWARQMDLLPGATSAPTLYGLGDDLEARTLETWAAAILQRSRSDRLIVVGCSIGGSCALELAALAPERVAALVLIGTKADLRPDPDLLSSALRTIHRDGLETAWRALWEPLFSKKAASRSIEEGRRIAMQQAPAAVARGVSAFHHRRSRGTILRSFPRPIVVISGADDVAPGPKTSAMQAEMAPHGRLHIIPDCGHYVPLERPDALNSILRQVVEQEVEEAGAMPRDGPP